MLRYLDTDVCSLLSQKLLLFYEVSLMKRKEPANKNQKYIAIFLALTMFLSAVLVYFDYAADPKKDNDNNVSGNTTEPPTVSFSQLPGKQVRHPFNSIADGLNMSPKGVIVAEYVDLQKARGTPLEQILGNTKMMKALYGADVTKRYGAFYADGNGFELHQIPEQKILAPWAIVPYDKYSLLERTNGTQDIWNVVGSPVILGPRQTVQNVIGVLEGNTTNTTEYNTVLSYADPANVIFQQVASRTNNTNFPAEQVYTDFKKLDDGSYEDTSIFLNARPELTRNITAYQANSSERGVTYNVTTAGNITKLVMNSDFASLLNETQLLSL
jgi:hypothetical protein